MIGSSLLNGGLGILGSIGASVVKSVFDLRIKDKELKELELKYSMAKDDRLHEQTMLSIKLESAEKLQTLESIENEKERSYQQNTLETTSALDTFKSNSDVDKIRIENTYVPENAKWVDKFNAFIRPYIAFILSTVFAIVFASYIYISLSKIDDLVAFNSIMNQDFVKYGLYFIENIISYFFGSRTLKRN